MFAFDDEEIKYVLSSSFYNNVKPLFKERHILTIGVPLAMVDVQLLSEARHSGRVSRVAMGWVSRWMS